ncbi:MAG: bifunctional adenosylcobinamide kinase/adenosylcobinamide-phosphate guanylyltransferase [Eggerthellaceae bacterium]|nr:bifunctional adenosylcobinamide kinase/adenosylcobinamide-phosphate guanylyltransferase [Eggerthellaceae bacterium]
MIFVIGGVASGKRSYARSLGYVDSDMGDELSSSCPVIFDVQELVRDGDADAASLAELLATTKQVVLCQEVGSGIVPVSRGERDWRDRAGALSKELADRADAVVRMVSGIPQVLKGADWLESQGLGRRGADEGSHPAFGASFFTNRACEYFPCHDGIDERDFNCMFCYCPLYALGPDCGGNFTYTKSGRKNCKNCALPHVRENGAKLVSSRYEQLAKLAHEREEVR